MLTLAIEAASGARPEARVLIIGRSANVLSETVRLLRAAGYAAGASNDFDGGIDQFDLTAVDVVVFGGMVPPGSRERIRQEILSRHPAITFVQGLAGIPGVIAAQVRAALGADAGAQPRTAVTYDPQSRTLHLRRETPEDVRVTAWWGTTFTPPEPRSTSLVLLDAALPAGAHTVPLPGEVPPQASFVTVTAGSFVQVLVVGPMPAGTTMAPLAGPPGP